VAIPRVWQERIGFDLGKKSIEHSIANRRRRNSVPLAGGDEPTEAHLHALVW